MPTRPLKHSVLVTQTMSGRAITRLGTFFDVEMRIEDRVPSGDELVDWLHGKAGVIADSRFLFDAPVIRHLPHLKAICNLDAAHHNLDLQALTNAGIRATNTPVALAAQSSIQAGAGQAWRVPGSLQQQVAPSTGAAGRYCSRWSRRVRFNLLGPMVGSEDVGDIAAEELIAALGFGRNSWHPRYLLNPDVLCQSCC